jgi:hypothetical protein
VNFRLKRPGLPGRFCFKSLSDGLFIGTFRRTIARQHEQKATPAVESLPYIVPNWRGDRDEEF